MGFLQIKGPPSMTPPPSTTGSGQGAVDRLATFFLSKFQETKQESELTTLQCTTQLKFEAIEKMLEEQTRATAKLRTEMQAEMQSEAQSFRDKAASLFLDKFSAQLDTLGARRSEKGELALSRLEHRVDDEVKNLADQLSDLSTNVAINNVALKASLDDTRRNISSGNEVWAENLRRCESEVRSKLSRLETMFDSSKTEAAIEKDKLTRMFQEANKRLQGKVDSLELTVMRQSEELAGQSEKIDRLETELRTLSQIGLGQEKAQVAVMNMISTQNDEITKLALDIRNNNAESNSRARSTVSRLPALSKPTPLQPRAALIPSFPIHGVEYAEKLQVSATPKAYTSMVFGQPAKDLKNAQIGTNGFSAQRKRSRAQGKTSPPSAHAQTDDEDSEPSPKRAHASRGQPTHERSLLGDVQERQMPAKVVDGTKEVQPITNRMQNARRDSSKRTAKSPAQNRGLPPKKSKETMSSQIVPPQTANSSTKTGPVSLKRKLDEFGESPSKPETALRTQQYLSPRGKMSSTQTKKQNQEQKVQEEASTLHVQPVQKPISARSRGKVGQTNGSSSPGGKTDRGNAHQQNFANRREATVAFMKHVQAFARDFIISPPRSERQYIWSFLEAIPDAAWAEFIQKKLLEEHPESVRPSLGIRAKNSINFDSGLTWRHVLETVRRLQQKPSASNSK